MDLTGLKFGDWLVLGESTEKKFYARCQCACGAISDVWKGNLKNGSSKQCTKCRSANNVIHGKSNSPAYNIWYAMRDRCTNTSNVSYGLYGGRGIRIDPRWESFEQFYKDMGDKPTGHSLERKDVNGPYSPDNCVWATASAQNRNKRNNKLKFKDALDIRYSNLAIETLAAKYNIHSSNVYAIKHNITWRAVTIPQQVAECHAKFGIPQYDVPKLLDEGTAKFRHMLMVEEVSEFWEAFQKRNIVDQVDACLDLLYVAAGALLVMGLSVEQIDACFAEVQKANMSKVKCETDAESKRGNKVDLRKPEGWVGPEERIKAILGM